MSFLSLLSSHITRVWSVRTNISPLHLSWWLSLHLIRVESKERLLKDKVSHCHTHSRTRREWKCICVCVCTPSLFILNISFSTFSFKRDTWWRKSCQYKKGGMKKGLHICSCQHWHDLIRIPPLCHLDLHLVISSRNPTFYSLSFLCILRHLIIISNFPVLSQYWRLKGVMVYLGSVSLPFSSLHWECQIRTSFRSSYVFLREKKKERKQRKKTTDSLFRVAFDGKEEKVLPFFFFLPLVQRLSLFLTRNPILSGLWKREVKDGMEVNEGKMDVTKRRVSNIESWIINTNFSSKEQ